MNYRKNYLATTMASSSFLIDLVHVMSGEQLYRASFEHPELLCLPSVEWQVHEYVMSTPFMCTAPTRNRRVCGEICDEEQNQRSLVDAFKGHACHCRRFFLYKEKISTWQWQ